LALAVIFTGSVEPAMMVAGVAEQAAEGCRFTGGGGGGAG